MHSTHRGTQSLYNLPPLSLFAMIFLFSDPYSTPKSRVGRVIFGILIGCFNAYFRMGSYYTEAMVYALLLANLLPTFEPVLSSHTSGEICRLKQG